MIRYSPNTPKPLRKAHVPKMALGPNVCWGPKLSPHSSQPDDPHRWVSADISHLTGNRWLAVAIRWCRSTLTATGFHGNQVYCRPLCTWTIRNSSPSLVRRVGGLEVVCACYFPIARYSPRLVSLRVQLSIVDVAKLSNVVERSLLCEY